jgi:hypothetical protein
LKSLTLEEAAKELGITKAGVYKRVQRGTLPHTKGADGRVYVYLDAGQGVRADTCVGESVTDDRSQPRSWWDYAVGASGFLAVLGAMIYVLGLLALLLPIAQSYTHDFATAWYAASLAPTTLVAGLGVKSLFGMPLAALVAWGLTVIGHRFVALSLLSSETLTTVDAFLSLITRRIRTRRIFYSVWNYVTMSAVTVSVVMFWLAVFGVVSLPSFIPSFKLTGFVVLLVVIITLSYVGLATKEGKEAFGLRFEEEEVLPKLASRSSLVKFISLLFLWLFALGTLSAVYTGPALPTIEITSTYETRGTLLAHTDRFWYLFDQDGELIAIPDDAVKTVQVSPEGE